MLHLSDTAFEDFYKAIIAASESLPDEPVLPKQRKHPRRIDDGAPSHHQGCIDKNILKSWTLYVMKLTDLIRKI